MFLDSTSSRNARRVAACVVEVRGWSGRAGRVVGGRRQYEGVFGGCTLGWGACPLGYVAIRGSNGPPAATALPGDTRGPADIGIYARSTHRAIRGAFPHPKRVSIAHLACTFVLTEMHMPSFLRHSSLFITGPCFRNVIGSWIARQRACRAIHGAFPHPKRPSIAHLACTFMPQWGGACEFPGSHPWVTRGPREHERVRRMVWGFFAWIEGM